MKYPKHLSERIRMEVAIGYLKHELRKLFPSIKENEIENLTRSKELCLPRDFWNGLHGISMGFKLKNVLYLITAENIKWQRKKIKIDNLIFGVELDKTTTDIEKGKLEAKKVVEFYKKNIFKKAERLEFMKNIRKGIKRNSDPIIVVDNRVHDGNGRLAWQILKNRKYIDCFQGIYKTKNKEPKNFWLPTSFLMDILYFGYQTNDKNKKYYKKVIEEVLRFSESGKIEYYDRALTKNPGVKPGF